MSESESTKTTVIIIIISPSSLLLKLFEKLRNKSMRHLECQKVQWLKCPIPPSGALSTPYSVH